MFPESHNEFTLPLTFKYNYMEIKVNIPKNDYVQPMGVRQEVVQGICDAFLAQNCWSVFHPFSNSGYRKATKFIIRDSHNGDFYGFSNKCDQPELGVEFNGAEMKCAFECLIKAGYHIYRRYEYGTWLGYIVHKKPHLHDAQEVFEFSDFID